MLDNKEPIYSQNECSKNKNYKQASSNARKSWDTKDGFQYLESVIQKNEKIYKDVKSYDKSKVDKVKNTCCHLYFQSQNFI